MTTVQIEWKKTQKWDQVYHPDITREWPKPSLSIPAPSFSPLIYPLPLNFEILSKSIPFYTYKRQVEWNYYIIAGFANK